MTTSLQCERHEFEFLKAKCEGLEAQLNAKSKALRARRRAEVEYLHHALKQSYRIQSEQKARLKTVEANNVTIKKQIENLKREGEKNLQNIQNSFQHKSDEVERLRELEKSSRKTVQDIAAFAKDLRSRSKSDGGITTDVASVLTSVCKILGVSESDTTFEKEKERFMIFV